MARAVAQVAGIYSKTKVGNIPPEKLKLIETIIEDQLNMAFQYGLLIEKRLRNRREFTRWA